jgi:D-galactose 1-dehydrogenase
MKKSIRVGIVGFGHIGAVYTEAFKYSPNFQLVAVVDTDDSIRGSLPRDIHFFTDAKDMVDAGIKVDVAIVAVPQNQHFYLAQFLLNAGIDVLLEKPATSTWQQLNYLINCANNNGRMLMFAMHAAYGGEVRWFAKNQKQHSALTSLGPIVGFWQGFYDPYIVNGKLLPAGESLGGSFQDSGINALSVLHALGFKNIRFTGKTKIVHLGEYEVRESAYIQCALSSPRNVFTGVIHTDWTLGENYKVTKLFFEGGQIVTLDHSAEMAMLTEMHGSISVVADCANGRPRLVNHYVYLLQELAERLESQQDNAEMARAVHEPYFNFYKNE